MYVIVLKMVFCAKYKAFVSATKQKQDYNFAALFLVLG